jgi:hypothetical protein
MTYRVGSDLSRRAKKYRARQFVSDYEIEPRQPELPLCGSYRPMREELHRIAQRANVRTPRAWLDKFLFDD